MTATKKVVLTGVHPELERVCREYAAMLNTTGGDDPVRLLEAYQEDRFLALRDVSKYARAVAVLAQASLLLRLEREGLLSR